MNIFLVGNGFDLHYLLPTTYTNFLNTIDYLLRNKEQEFEHVGDVFYGISKLKLDEAIAISYEKYKIGYDCTELPQKVIHRMTTIAETNPWFQYFWKRIIRGFGWIDFEKEISNVLVIMNTVFHCVSAKEDISKEIQSDVLAILEDFKLGSLFTTSSAPFLLENCSYLKFASNPDFLFKFSDEFHFIQPEPPSYSSFNDAAVIAVLSSSLYDFSELLATYLKFFIDNPVKIISKKHLFDRNMIFEMPGTVVSLNYTHTFEIMYSASRNARVMHPHGTVDSKIILGINSDEFDELPKLDTRFLDFKKYYQKAVYQTDDSFNAYLKRLRKYKGRDSGCIDLFVFGHSLDMTDKEIIQELFEIADSIVIYFHKPSDKFNYAKKLISIYQKDGYERLRKKKGLFYVLAKDLDRYWINRLAIAQKYDPVGPVCKLAVSDKSVLSDFLRAVKARAKYIHMAQAESTDRSSLMVENNLKNEQNGDLQKLKLEMDKTDD